MINLPLKMEAYLLLNVDRKIGDKKLASRLQNIQHYVLNRNQSHNVPGDSILDNLYIVVQMYLLEKVPDCYDDGSLDQEKV